MKRIKIWNIDDIKQANRVNGFYFFEPDTMRFFKSRVLDTVYQGIGGVYFVTSEKGPNEVRRYTVRIFNSKTYNCETAKGNEFNELTKAAAQGLAGRLARGTE